MDILDIFGHFYLNHLSPLWGYFQFKKQNIKRILENGKNTGKVREFCQSGKVGTMIKNLT